MMKWQDALAIALGAEKASPVERQRAFQMLHDTGIGYNLGDNLAETLRHMVASGSIMETTDG